MPRSRTTRVLREELPDILKVRGLSVRALARGLDISDAHLVRVLNGSKQPSAELARRISDLLELPRGYFPEDREGAVIDAVRNDPDLRDRLYRQLRK